MIDVPGEISKLIATYLQVIADIALDANLMSVKLQKLTKQFGIDYNAIIDSANREAEAAEANKEKNKPKLEPKT